MTPGSWGDALGRYGMCLVQERVPETVEVERVMESMIQLDGAKVLFPTSCRSCKR